MVVGLLGVMGDAISAQVPDTQPSRRGQRGARTETGGDLKDIEYWHAKYFHLMVQAAVNSEQPASLIAWIAGQQVEVALPGLVRRYPQHADLRAWLAADQEILRRAD